MKKVKAFKYQIENRIYLVRIHEDAHRFNISFSYNGHVIPPLDILKKRNFRENNTENIVALCLTSKSFIDGWDQYIRPIKDKKSA